MSAKDDAEDNPEGQAAKLLSPTIDEIDALPPNLRYNNFDMLCTIISISTYLFDLVMDCIVAFHFFHLGVTHGVYHYWYFGLTLTFVFLPSLTMTGFSLRWYLIDAENSQLPPVPTWKWILRVIVLLLQIAPILRYIDSMRFGLKSRKYGKIESECEPDSMERKTAREQRIKYYTLMVYEDADATLLRLFECFMESAPQLILQIYILIRDPSSITLEDPEEFKNEEDETKHVIKSSILLISIISSLCSLAWSLVVYHRSLRYTFPEKKNLHWKGSIFQFLWHFSSITARVIALSLFASLYPVWIGPACVVHWLIMSTWVIFQNTTACNTKFEELLFCLVLGAIYIFSFFNAKEERTRYKYLIYYSFCFLENSALMLLWFFCAKNIMPQGQTAWYYYPAIIGHYLAFFVGLAFMITYYVYFHPSGIDIPFLKKRKPKTQSEETKPSMEPEATELKPISIQSISTPALDEADLASNKQIVRRTISEPVPQNQAHLDNIKARRSLKKMQGNNNSGGDH